MLNDLKVRLIGDDSDLQSTLKASTAALAKWSSAAVLAAGAAGVAIVKSGLDSADALAKQAQQLNTTSKDLMTLQRSASMAGVSQEQLNSATRALTTRLSQAAAGTGTAGQALEALGLSMEQVGNLPLSDKIAVINDALKNNVSQSNAAAIAAQLYGEEAALSLSKIDASVLATAASEIDVFNAALSDIDAAKIENANDAMSRLGLAFDSVKMQSAAEFSGILNGIADNIFEAAKETDFFESGIRSAMDIGITGAGYLADAFRGAQIAVLGISTAFSGVMLAGAMAAESVVGAWDDAMRAIADGFNVVIRQINKIPGVDLGEIVVGENKLLGKLGSAVDHANEMFEGQWQKTQDLYNEELPSTALDRWVEAVRQKSQEAAEATVEARKQIGANVVPDETGTTESDKGDPLKAQKDEAQKRLDVIRQSFLDEQGLASEKYVADLEALQEAFDLELMTIKEHDLAKAMLEERYTEESLERQKQAAEKEKAIAEAQKRVKINAVSQTFAALSTLMETNSRELFEVGKAAAISGAIVDGYAGVQKTLASVPAPFNYALAAAQGVAAAANVAKIASTSFGSGGSVSPSTAGGSASSATAATTQQTAQTAPQQQVSIALSGDVYSRQSVVQLIEQINEAVSDGARIRVA